MKPYPVAEIETPGQVVHFRPRFRQRRQDFQLLAAYRQAFIDVIVDQVVKPLVLRVRIGSQEVALTGPAKRDGARIADGGARSANDHRQGDASHDAGCCAPVGAPRRQKAHLIQGRHCFDATRVRVHPHSNLAQRVRPTSSRPRASVAIAEPARITIAARHAGLFSVVSSLASLLNACAPRESHGDCGIIYGQSSKEYL